jgi:serine/threonine-protein kinase
MAAVANVGDVLEGRYKILSTLGEGGMGSVFLAQHVLIKRRVAVKILHPDLATDANVVERFMNEARAAGTLGHPNIVESTDMGFTPDHIPYIVFEHLEGTPLTDEIYRVKGFSLRRSLWVAQQICSALHAAHEAGVVHRDLKSDNVFLTDRAEMLDHVKVLDFGISRFTDVTLNESDHKMVMGTPEYLSPEAITDPASIDRRADIYALGVILYEMLTARRPFSGADQKSLLHSIVYDAPAELLVPEVPKALETIVMEKLLAKNPADRFATMLDVETALEKFTSEKPTPMRRARPLPTDPPLSAAERIPGTRTPPPGAAIAMEGASPFKRAGGKAPASRPLWPFAVAAVGIVVGIIGIVFGLMREPTVVQAPGLGSAGQCAPKLSAPKPPGN